jgi:hypothetical protein
MPYRVLCNNNRLYRLPKNEEGPRSEWRKQRLTEWLKKTRSEMLALFVYSFPLCQKDFYLRDLLTKTVDLFKTVYVLLFMR